MAKIQCKFLFFIIRDFKPIIIIQIKPIPGDLSPHKSIDYGQGYFLMPMEIAKRIE